MDSSNRPSKKTCDTMDLEDRSNLKIGLSHQISDNTFTDSFRSRNERGSTLSNVQDSSNKRAAFMIPDRFRNFISNRYEKYHKDPHDVDLEKISDARGNGPSAISEIRIGKTISKFCSHIWWQAFNLRSLGLTKFSVTFPNGDIANRLVTEMQNFGDHLFEHTSWTAYIPSCRIFTRVTRDIDKTETSE